MRLVMLTDPVQWTVQHQGKSVAIGGTTFFSHREDAVQEISKRGLTVRETGEIVRTPEPVITESVPEAPVETEVVQEAPVESGDVPDAPVESAEATESKRRGRPRTFSEEEAAERRRQQNREYYRQRPPERKNAVRERSKDWRESNPDKVKEYRQRANEKRRERYRTDPEYRAKVDASNKAYQERKKTNKEN